MAEIGKKYKLASNLSKIVGTSQTGEKIMDTPVNFPFARFSPFLGMSPIIFTTRHGIPHDSEISANIFSVDASSSETSADVITDVASVISIDVDSIGSKSYYALSSGRAKVYIDDRLAVNTTLDNGSEINIMPKRFYDQPQLSIDTTVRWRINAYNTGSNEETPGPIGACHDVPVNLGSVEMKLHSCD
jgi:hypothetical protein